MKKYQFTLMGLAMLLFVITSSAAAQGRDGGGRLEGTWDTRVRLTNCLTGQEITTFPSIGSFIKGGISIGSTGGMPQSGRTPEHGVWRHDGGNIYSFKFKTFSFTQNVPSGWTIVEHQIILNSTADAYTSAGTAKFFAPDGTQTGSGCSDAVGTRFSF